MTKHNNCNEKSVARIRLTNVTMIFFIKIEDLLLIGYPFRKLNYDDRPLLRESFTACICRTPMCRRQLLSGD